MAVKRTGQLSLVEAHFLGDKLAGGSSPLDRLSGLVKWYRFEKLLNPLRDGGPGRAVLASRCCCSRRCCCNRFTGCLIGSWKRRWATGCRSVALPA